MKDEITNFGYNSERWLSIEDFNGEIWKDIPGYEGWYKVSNLGRIKSIERTIVFKRGCDNVHRKKTLKEQIIKASTSSSYLFCHLKKKGTSVIVKHHRIVCSVFHENKENLPEVNHKNEIKTDNRADNLEWCTRSYNARYGTSRQRVREKLINDPNRSTPVLQYSLNGVFIKKYPSIKEAERQTGICYSNISDVSRGGRCSTAGGYIWSFSDNRDVINKKVMRKQINKAQYSKKKVLMFSKDNKLINTFESEAMASKETGIHKDTIARCCKHIGYYKTAGGFKWEYA